MLSLRFAVLAIILVVLLFQIPLFPTMEVASYDLRVKVEARLNPVPQSSDIVILGIDDESLMSHGRWPWPRHYWDEILDILIDLGAKAIFLDVAFREPAESIVEPHPGAQPLEEVLKKSLDSLRHEMSGPQLSDHLSSSLKASPVVSQVSTLFTQGVDVVEGELRELAAPPDSLIGQSLAFARMQGVLVTGLCTVTDAENPADVLRAKSRQKARRWLLDNPRKSVSDLDATDRRLLSGELEQLILFRKLYQVLELHPNLNFAVEKGDRRASPWSVSATIVTSEGGQMLPAELVRYGRENVTRVRAQLIEDRAEMALAAFARPADKVDLGELKAGPLVATLGPLGRLVDTLADQVLARHHVPSRLGPPIHGIENIPQLGWGTSLVPPVSAVAKELDVVGADNEVKDADGLLRSTRLFWQVGDHIIPAAAFGMYLELLRRMSAPQPIAVWVEPGPRVVVRVGLGRQAAKSVRIPVTPSGQCLINWAGPWETTFDKFSLGLILTYAGIQKERDSYLLERFKAGDFAMPLRLGEIARELWLSRRTDSVTLSALMDIVSARNPGLSIQEATVLGSGQPYAPRSLDEARPPRDWHRFFQSLRTSREDQLFKADAAGLARIAAIKDPKRRESRMRPYLKIEKAYRRYVTELDALKKALKEKIRGRICFIGNVSSSSTDLAPMAFGQNYPKLGSHVNLLNTLLNERFVTRPPALAVSLRGLIDPATLQLPLLLAVSLVMALALLNLSSLQGARLAAVFFVLWTAFSFALLTWYGIWIDLVAPLLATTTTYVAVFTWRSRRTENIRKMFETYVDPRIVSVLVENEALWKELGGREQVITAFFSDIAGFTTLSELLDPHELSAMLTAYLSPMTEAILRRSGTRDKYIGDAIVAFFGAPLPSEDHPLQACLAAIEQQELLVELKRRWKQDRASWYGKILDKGKDLQFRVGLNTGRAKVGNFGSHECKNYTMIGDSVNLASRLEGANKEYGTFVMASEATIARCSQAIVTRELDRLVVKGKLEAVRVFEIVGRSGNVGAPLQDVLGMYAEGLAHYYARRFDHALARFSKALELRPDDGPSKVYSKRSELFIASPPPNDWDGTFVMTHK